MKDTKGAQSLRNLVTPKRIAQQEVADKCGVSQQAVSSWMQSRAKPTPDRMRVLQEVFDISMESWTDPPDPSLETEDGSDSESKPNSSTKAAG
jgi:transcriptional regulator with XRE-family HTH domain